jgi:4-cresol dehydrogenase (hydroxylating)
MIAGGLYGSKGVVAAARREVRRHLSGPGRTLHFFDQRKLDLLERLSRPLAGFRRVAALRGKLASLQSLYDMNRGIPSYRFLAGAYWRHRQGLPADFSKADPAEDGCGLLWFPPVLPFTGEAVKELLSLAEPIFARYGFDFLITLSSVTERSLGGVMTIAYDLEDEAECAAARDCANTLCETMMDAGFPPYRVSPQFLPYLARGSETYWDVVAGLKRLMDPAEILSPGRYQPISRDPRT